MKYYLVGIKGTGMSSLANILADLGNEVYGVDYNKKYFTEATFRGSIKVESFDNYTLDKNCFYIIGNAYKLHKITNEIKELNLNFSYYPEFLENFFKMKKIGISGSHGKTTATFFASQLLDEKINVLVGDGTGYGFRDAKYFLFEACEYQNHFLKYTFDYLVILNIDYDHPDFFKSPNEYFYAFQKAALNAKTLIINADDSICRKIVHKNKITFGFDENSDIVLKINDNKLFLTFLEDEYCLDFNYYGSYMAYNLAVSFILMYLTKEDKETISTNINHLKLPNRRLEEYITDNGNILVNDYAHHPTEISAVISLLKNKYPHKKIICIYQGHTYSRTNSFAKEYVKSLLGADVVFIMPIFTSVREEGVDPYLLLDMNKTFLKYSRQTINMLLKKDNLVVAFLGAGDIDNEFNFFK